MKKVTFVALFLLVALTACSDPATDQLAQCLTEKGVVMYGAYWCPHCQDQKNLFGSSFDYVTYVECSLPNRGGQTQVCIDENITSYPTWEFADGSRVSNVIPLDRLAAVAGCQSEATP